MVSHRPAGRRPHAILQSDGRGAGQRRRGVLPDGELGEDAAMAARRSSTRRRRSAGRRSPRHLDRPDQRQPHDREPRRRHLDHAPTAGKTWSQIQLPIAQIYHVTVDDRIPYFVYGNRQDGPSARGPSNSQLAGLLPATAASRAGMWIVRGRRRERLGHARSGGLEHRLVERLGLRQRRRHRHPATICAPGIARTRRGLARGDDRPSGGAR